MAKNLGKHKGKLKSLGTVEKIVKHAINVETFFLYIRSKKKRSKSRIIKGFQYVFILFFYTLHANIVISKYMYIFFINQKLKEKIRRSFFLHVPNRIRNTLLFSPNKLVMHRPRSYFSHYESFFLFIQKKEPGILPKSLHANLHYFLI